MNILDSIRAQLVVLVKQAGAFSCQVEYCDGNGVIEVDASGQVRLSGRAQAVYSDGVSLTTLSLPDLARLAEVAAYEISLSPQQRSERDQRQRDEKLYASRKIAANRLAFSDEPLCPKGYSIGASAGWKNFKTTQWTKDVSLDHPGPSILNGKLVVEFAENTDEVVRAELELEDGTILGCYRAAGEESAMF